ncbi:hypothetical protein V6Z11_D10G287600 [Gossypium hirsutum]
MLSGCWSFGGAICSCQFSLPEWCLCLETNDAIFHNHLLHTVILRCEFTVSALGE